MEKKPIHITISKEAYDLLAFAGYYYFRKYGKKLSQSQAIDISIKSFWKRIKEKGGVKG